MSEFLNLCLAVKDPDLAGDVVEVEHPHGLVLRSVSSNGEWQHVTLYVSTDEPLAESEPTEKTYSRGGECLDKFERGLT